MRERSMGPESSRPSASGAAGRLFKEPEAGGLQCPREPDG